MSNDRAYLTHIRDSLHEVQTFIQGESYESFLENRMGHKQGLKSMRLFASEMVPRVRKMVGAA